MMFSLPFYSGSKGSSNPSAPSPVRKWIPTLITIAAVACVAMTANPAPGQEMKGLAKTHFDTVFNNESGFGADAARNLLSSEGGKASRWRILNIFSDAKIDPRLPSSSKDRPKWGTARAYPPAVDEANGRTLYEAHVDVSDQFTSFGKISVGLLYFLFWIFLMFPNWFWPVGRPGIALAGGMLMIVYRYVLYSVGQGPWFQAENVIIKEPLYLLFGLMLTTVYLEKMEKGGMFDKLRDSLDDPISWKRSFKIMMMSTIGSAAVMNDSIVLIFSGVVVDLCVRHKVDNSLPYLLSLATTANIGSALTMTGNPQNILIAALAYDDIAWLAFAANMALPVLAGTLINTTMMLVYYRAELFPGANGLGECFGIFMTGSKTPEMLSLERQYYARKSTEENTLQDGWSLWSKLQVLVVIAFLAFFAAGFDVSCVCISAGIILMVLTSWKRYSWDPKPVPTDDEGNPIPPKTHYDMDGNEIVEEEEMITESETTLTEVDYGLLLLFIGQFLLIGSFDDTGIPQAFFAICMGGCAEVMCTVPCVYWFVAIITFLSNVASNVPICQMLAATFPYATPYEWMQVSFSATIAGNLTMLGSAANMIVAFQAAKVGDRTFTSERHAPFGIPSTFLCLYAGTAIMTYISFLPDCSVKLGTCEDQLD